MIETINFDNIDDRVLIRAKKILDNNGLVCVPTDTSFSIVCSPNSKLGIDKLKNLKGKGTQFTMTLICCSISQVNEYAELSNSNFKILKKYTPGPFVFILPTIHSTEKKLNMKRAELGVRIPDSKPVTELIKLTGYPLFAITASKSMLESGWWHEDFAEQNLFEYGYEMEDIREIEMIIDNNTNEPHMKIQTTVVDLQEEELTIIRLGAGIL